MTNLKHLSIISILTLAISCNYPSDTNKNVHFENDTVNYVQKEIKLKGEEFEVEEENEIKIELAIYKGSWFDIQYPSNFKATPIKSDTEGEDYEYTETDEAYFLSPDSTVEFFVYSPQWGGNPFTYLDLADNEELESEKNTVDEIMPDIVFNWVTIKDKEGKYTRSYYSKHTESTHLVFGIKYNNQNIYDLYKADYTAFKKSLIQYAD